MTRGAIPPASLARPVAALGVLATLVVAFHGDGHDPTPALPMALLTLTACCLRTRTTRIVFFAPACLFVFAFLSSFARVSTSDRDVYRILLYIRLLEGAFFALLLAPLVISSLRGGARQGTILDRSQRRSPWAMAAGTAGLFGELSSAYYCSWLLVPDRRKPFRHSQWEHGVVVLYGFAAACALGFVVADLRALARMRRIAQWARDGRAPAMHAGAWIDVGVGEETRRLSTPADSRVPAASEVIVRGSPGRALRSLAVSIGIDLVALAVAVAVAYRRIVAPPE